LITVDAANWQKGNAIFISKNILLQCTILKFSALY